MIQYISAKLSTFIFRCICWQRQGVYSWGIIKWGWRSLAGLVYIVVFLFLSLQSEVVKLTEEHQSLSELVSQLEAQLGVVRLQLQEEAHNCRLLMDFPFLKQTSDDYSTHIASLSGRESQKQISANTVRILLLEEQNSELRQRTVAATQMAREKQMRRFQVCVHVCGDWLMKWSLLALVLASLLLMKVHFCYT